METNVFFRLIKCSFGGSINYIAWKGLEVLIAVRHCSQ